jgi:hypothetical protein
MTNDVYRLGLVRDSRIIGETVSPLGIDFFGSPKSL